MAIDIGALHLRREILSRLGSLERQHQTDLVGQSRCGTAERVDIQDDARVAQRHDPPGRRIEAFAHVVHLGIEGRVATDQDWGLGPQRARRRCRAVAVIRDTYQDFRAGFR